MLRVPIYNRIWRDKLRQRISAIPIELLKWKFTSGSILPAGAPAKLAESLAFHCFTDDNQSQREWY